MIASPPQHAALVGDDHAAHASPWDAAAAAFQRHENRLPQRPILTGEALHNKLLADWELPYSRMHPDPS